MKERTKSMNKSIKIKKLKIYIYFFIFNCEIYFSLQKKIWKRAEGKKIKRK
jgi:hypothetical protein